MDGRYAAGQCAVIYVTITEKKKDIGPRPLRKTVMSVQSRKKCSSYRSVMSIYAFVVIMVLASSPAVDSVMIPREWTMYIEQLISTVQR